MNQRQQAISPNLHHHLALMNTVKSTLLRDIFLKKAKIFLFYNLGASNLTNYPLGYNSPNSNGMEIFKKTFEITGFQGVNPLKMES